MSRNPRLRSTERKIMSLRITILALTCCLTSLAFGDDVPPNVKKWQDKKVEMQALHVTVFQNSVNSAEKTLAIAQKDLKKPTPGKGDRVTPERLKYLRSEVAKAKTALAEPQAGLKKAKLRDVNSFVPDMPPQPAIGDIGSFSDSVMIVDGKGPLVMIEVNGRFLSGERFTRSARYEKHLLLLEGVDASQWPNDKRVTLPQTFEAVRVDKLNRLMVLKPFDVEKWKLLVDTEVKPNPNPEVKPESKPKAKP